MSQAPKNPSYTLLQENFADFLPKSWLWWVDQSLPRFVKENYSPQKSWSDKPFSLVDAQFYFKSIKELSDLFTVGRSSKSPDYFTQAKFRSAYLLYFFALQASKFLYLFKKHEFSFHQLLKSKELTLFDLGSGPATASLSVLMKLQEQTQTPDQITVILNDQNAAVLKDAKKLIEMYAAQFSNLRNKVTVKTYCGEWWKTPSLISKSPTDPAKFYLMGHLLNESSLQPKQKLKMAQTLNQMLESKNSQLLILEPAQKEIAQFISTIKNESSESSTIIGPCLHQGICPLTEGKDWCHFSQPIQIDGKWLGEFAKRLESPKTWLKLTYLWISTEAKWKQSVPSRHKLVVSDPLRTKDGQYEVQLCEENQVARLRIKKTDPLRHKPYRGQKITLQSS